MPLTNDFFVDQSSIAQNVRIFGGASIKRSRIDGGCIVGNDSILENCELESYISINRRNYLLRSKIGSFSYTGIDTQIRSAEIGRFCSISWGVSVGGANHHFDRATTSPLWMVWNDDEI
jgi:ADP-glucose pyrophosphorylase